MKFRGTLCNFQDFDCRIIAVSKDPIESLRTWVAEEFAEPIGLLYLDADGAGNRGKGVYLDILEACYDRLTPGAVILAHNHPSGIAEPSQADELITGRLREALALVDIRVLDHIVVGDGACVSFAERGLL